MQYIKKPLALFRNNLRLVLKTLPILWNAAPLESSFIAIMLIVQGLIPSFTLFIIREIVDAITEALSEGKELTFEAILGFVAAWVVAILVESILNPWVTIAQANLSAKLTAHMNILLMKKGASFPGLNYFENAEFYNEIEVVNSEASYSPLNLLLWLTQTIRYLLIILSMLVLLAAIGWWLPLLLLLASLPQTYIVSKMQYNIWDLVVSKSQEIRQMHYFRNVMLTDGYAKEVRIFNLGDFCVKHYRDAFERFHQETWRVRRKQALWSTILVLLSAAGNVIAFLYIVNQTIGGLITLGSVIVFVQALAYVQQNLGRMGEAISALLETLLYVDKFFKFIERSPDLELAEVGQRVEIPQSGIRFDQVSFAYPDGREALQGISFEIKAGETVAIVGENGAGKTTLVKLLARFYDPCSGQILVNDTPLNALDLPVWREQLAVVFQDFNHFSLSVRDSIGMGDFENAAGIESAAEQAGFDKAVVRLPDGYDTQLGKQFDGTELSGGEWQKLAIARAFLRRQQAQILILDEPTASLDPRSEYEIYERFTHLTQSKTTLLITHRLASVRMADRIIVLKNGEIVEQGTHEALLENGGEYATLWDMQAQKYQ